MQFESTIPHQIRNRYDCGSFFIHLPDKRFHQYVLAEIAVHPGTRVPFRKRRIAPDGSRYTGLAEAPIRWEHAAVCHLDL